MKLLFVIPGEIDQPTGGYRYDRQILDQLEESSISHELLSLPGQFPLPNESFRSQALKLVERQKSHDVAVVDGLAGGGVPRIMQTLAKTAPVVSLIHHPLCLETGLSDSQKTRLHKLEKDGLAHVSLVITTSPQTAHEVGSLFGFDRRKIRTVIPGVERSSISKGSGTGTVNLLCVASVIERKDHKTLLQALSRLTALDWHLDCVGKTDFDPDLFSQLMDQVSRSKLQDKMKFHGVLNDEDLSNLYQKADLFVLPSRHEGYGMVFTEAIVRGIPIVATTAGAIPETVPADCGILVEPGNTSALELALESLIQDGELRQTFRQNSLSAAAAFPDWKSSAARFAACLKELT